MNSGPDANPGRRAPPGTNNQVVTNTQRDALGDPMSATENPVRPSRMRRAVGTDQRVGRGTEVSGRAATKGARSSCRPM